MRYSRFKSRRYNRSNYRKRSTRRSYKSRSRSMRKRKGQIIGYRM